MKQLELSRQFYIEHGKDMIQNKFGGFAHRIAVGLVGHGSECFGYDDKISMDHDVEVGFCMWLTADDERKIGFALSREYDKLRAEFAPKNNMHKSVAGQSAHGVYAIDDFYRRYTGCDGAPQSLQDWLYTDDFYFAEATNGEVFCDELGEFSRVRNAILLGMPHDVLLKKIAACALRMAQSGQYNYSRCLAHGEEGAAMFALNEFVDSASSMIFLLNRKHRPYFKWTFRAMKELPLLGDMAQPLEFLLTADNDKHTQTVKKEIIEDICLEICNEIRCQNIASCQGSYLEPFAYAINNSIKCAEIRNLHILYD